EDGCLPAGVWADNGHTISNQLKVILEREVHPLDRPKVAYADVFEFHGLSFQCDPLGCWRIRVVYTRVAHGVAAMSIDTNPKRERGFRIRSPRSRFGLVWLVSHPCENRSKV